MNVQEIRSKYLDLRSLDRNNPLQRHELLQLARNAETAELPAWVSIVEAFVASRDGDQEVAISHMDRALQLEPENVDALYLKGVLLASEKPEESLALLETVCHKLEASDDSGDLRVLAMAMVNKGVALGNLQKPEAEIATYDEVILRFGAATEPPLRESVAMAMVNKGVTLGQMQKTEEALAAYDGLVKRFGKATEPPLRESVATALFNKGVALKQMQKTEEAVASYDEVVKRFGEVTEPPLLETVAKAMVNKGVTFGIQQKHEEALAAYDEVVRRFGDASELPLRVQVAKALVNKGVTLGHMQKPEAEIATYDEVILRFGEATDSPLREQMAKAMVNKGVALGNLQRHEAEIATYDEVILRFGEATEPPLRETVAKAMVNKGVALRQMQKPEEAVASYDEVVKRFGKVTEPQLRKTVAKAMVNKGVALRQMQKPEEAVAAYDEVVKQFGEATEPPLRVQVAKALVYKGFMLGQMQKPEAEIATYDEVVRRFGDASELPLRVQVAKALVNKGVTLGHMQKPEAEITTYDEVIRRFGMATESPLRESLTKALVNKGVALEQMQKPEEAVAAYDEVIRRFRETTEPLLRKSVAMAMVNKGVALSNLQKPEEEIATYDEVEKFFGEATEPPLREQVAMAMVNKGITLGQMQKPEAAVAIYDEVVRRFGEATDSPLREQVARALSLKAITLHKTGKTDEAVGMIDKGLRFLETDSDTENKLVAKFKVLKALLLSTKQDQSSEDAKSEALEATKSDYTEQLKVYLDTVLPHFPEEKRDYFFAQMSLRKNQTYEFIKSPSQFAQDASLLLVLREWNSYTPAIPTEGERDRGGGYFLRREGQGIVVDPGYDFIDAFHRAGGRLCDIDHIIITHAHDDHTAELESLLMLLHRRAAWKDAEGKPLSPPPRRVSLYLSQGAERKFAGIIPLRDSKHIEKLVVLSRPTNGSVQKIRLTEGIELTVLPAYHDDVVTSDCAVGLGFTITTKGGRLRRIVITGDTGLYPQQLENGQPMFHDPVTKKRPLKDLSKALFENYGEFKKPDLLVAHIGSIKEDEFTPMEMLESSGRLQTSRSHAKEDDFNPTGRLQTSRRQADEWYYPNHLGLLGTLIMMDQLQPNSVVISEFGAELKDFREDLVNNLGKALNEKQTKARSSLTQVIAGDITIVYDVESDSFLCHEDRRFHPLKDLHAREVIDWKVKRNPDTNSLEPVIGTTKRMHLFTSTEDKRKDHGRLRDYYEDLFDRKLPYFRPQA